MLTHSRVPHISHIYPSDMTEARIECTHSTLAYGTKYADTPRLGRLVRINGVAANQPVCTGARSKRREGGARAQQ